MYRRGCSHYLVKRPPGVTKLPACGLAPGSKPAVLPVVPCSPAYAMTRAALELDRQQDELRRAPDLDGGAWRRARGGDGAARGGGHRDPGAGQRGQVPPPGG